MFSHTLFSISKCGFLSSSTQIWGNVLHDFLLDTKVVPMSGRDWDIIPKFTYPMQSNFEQFMCSWDRNPKFSPFEGMTLALQAHLFNRFYTRQGGQNWSLKPIYWALPPQGLSVTIALGPSFGSLGAYHQHGARAMTLWEMKLWTMFLSR